LYVVVVKDISGVLRPYTMAQPLPYWTRIPRYSDHGIAVLVTLNGAVSTDIVDYSCTAFKI